MQDNRGRVDSRRKEGLKDRFFIVRMSFIVHQIIYLDCYSHTFLNKTWAHKSVLQMLWIISIVTTFHLCNPLSLAALICTTWNIKSMLRALKLLPSLLPWPSNVAAPYYMWERTACAADPALVLQLGRSYSIHKGLLMINNHTKTLQLVHVPVHTVRVNQFQPK